MLPGFLLRMARRGNYRHKFGQRFGIFSAEARQKLAPGGWTWLHAVSVGEMVMALKLARALREARPGLRILLSTTTSTGFALAREQLESEMELIYYPLDLGFIVRRALDIVRPERVALVDKELWPNLVSHCYRRGIPVSIVNARLSPKSERGFYKWRRWVGPFFEMLENVCVQEPEDVARWRSLGVRQSALHCTGSLKFDFATPERSRAAEFRALLDAIGVDEDAPVLIGGSTFPGEEAILARVAMLLKKDAPGLFLILVPRHAERTAEVESVLRGLGLAYVLRSALDRGVPACESRPDALVVNTTGELRDWYAVADVCFIGKSMSARGGQNPAEPALVGRPAVFGPQMQNFGALVRQFLAAEGALQVGDEGELAQAVASLLNDPAKCRKLAKNAREVLRVHEGATRRTADILSSRLKTATHRQE